MLSEEIRDYPVEDMIEEDAEWLASVADEVRKLETEQKFRHRRGCKSWVEDTYCVCGFLRLQERNRELEAVADVMSSDDAVFIADVLTTATNTHGVNQTFNNDPYYLTQLAKELANALGDLEDGDETEQMENPRI